MCMKIDAGNKGPDSTFGKANALWRSRETHGRPQAYVDGSALWNACEAYFDPANDNPLYEYKIRAFQGEVAQELVAYIRAFTLIGLCLHIGISDVTWRDWRTSRLDLKETRPKAGRSFELKSLYVPSPGCWTLASSPRILALVIAASWRRQRSIDWWCWWWLPKRRERFRYVCFRNRLWPQSNCRFFLHGRLPGVRTNLGIRIGWTDDREHGWNYWLRPDHRLRR